MTVARSDGGRPNWQALLPSMTKYLKNPSPELRAVLAQMPAMQAPDGVESNLINPENIAYQQTTVTSILLAIMILFVFNRIYVKVWLVRKFSWDDGTLLIGIMGVLLQYATYAWACASGSLGRHMWDISVLDALSPNLTIPLYMLTVIPPPTYGFLKCTFFIVYLQLFYQLGWMRICSIIGLIFTSGLYTTFTILRFYYSTPRPGELFKSRDTQRTTSILWPMSIVGLILDVFILILPIMAVARLQTSSKKKFAAILVFLTGAMACISSGIGLYYRSKIHPDGDVTWKLIPCNIATGAEMMIGVMCACMPSVAYAYRHAPALQGLRGKLSPKISAILPSSIFKTRQNTLPTLPITDKSGVSAPRVHINQSENYYQLVDHTCSSKSGILHP